jgi:hypothetical protein
VNAECLATLLLNDDVEYRADSDPRIKPPDDTDFDPKDYAMELADPEAFLDKLGFAFLDEKDTYRRFKVDLPLDPPLTGLNGHYSGLRVYARVWPLDSNNRIYIRLVCRISRMVDGSWLHARPSAKKFYWAKQGIDMLTVLDQLKFDFSRLQLLARRVRTVAGFYRMIKSALHFEKL